MVLAATVLQQNGVWVNAPENIDPAPLTTLMSQHKVRWVCALMQEGFTEERLQEYVAERWWDRLGPRVIKIGWVNDTHGAAEGRVKEFCEKTSELVTRYKLQGVMFDFEKAWEAGPLLSKAEQDKRWQRWQQFTTEWRRLRPGLLTILSSYAYPPYVAFPWQNIAAAKIRYCPQNLYKYVEWYKCAYSLSGAKIVGYPLSYVHFMLSREEGHLLTEGVQHAWEAKRENKYSGGISAYYAETMTGADWLLMKKTVDDGLSLWNP